MKLWICGYIKSFRPCNPKWRVRPWNPTLLKLLFVLELRLKWVAGRAWSPILFSPFKLVSLTRSEYPHFYLLKFLTSEKISANGGWILAHIDVSCLQRRYYLLQLLTSLYDLLVLQDGEFLRYIDFAFFRKDYLLLSVWLVIIFDVIAVIIHFILQDR